jgi:hypothetical protein
VDGLVISGEDTKDGDHATCKDFDLNSFVMYPKWKDRNGKTKVTKHWWISILRKKTIDSNLFRRNALMRLLI